MQKIKLFLALVVVAIPLIGMQSTLPNRLDPAPDEIKRIVDDYRFVFELPTFVELMVRVLPHAASRGITPCAGLLLGEKRKFTGEFYVQLLSHTSKPYVGILIFHPNFLELQHGYQLGLILKMLYRAVQFNPPHEFVVVDSVMCPKGARQEAATNALLYLGCDCIECAQEFATCCSVSSNTDLTRAEAGDLIVQMAATSRLCAHHQSKREERVGR